jgi:hypothetical protein
MATVSLCLRCGYVNEWKFKSCVVCGSRLQPGFKRDDLAPGMRIEIKRLDPKLTARRLGKGRIFITPDNMVGIVRRRLVTSPGFLRQPILRYTTDHLVTPRHPDAFAIVVFIHDTLGVVSDAIRSVEWLIRSTAEAIGRAAGGPYVIEARLETGVSMFWKVSGSRPVAEATDEVFQAMSIGDLEFQAPDAERLLVD